MSDLTARELQALAGLLRAVRMPDDAAVFEKVRLSCLAM